MISVLWQSLMSGVCWYEWKISFNNEKVLVRVKYYTSAVVISHPNQQISGH